ncbi:uncharacterized protein N7459_000689 [Penicillium hispanicum]|uniref:uncharacterized protein n=1 Tax=Penicillium hispanicum TaxID=1080232 RepID=UPI0025422318|nr:uncharacterized protein N7459_000689 [Penicillium hispanicum]KAJ5594481.1 hypothetical protein N7459_000689 [Penicillium hispanicum]
MARRTSRLSASVSATPVLADVPTHETPDATSLDVPEQLLTPENSRSETSSNNENALAEDKSITRRRSTRVVRASLQAAESLETTPIDKDETTASSSQVYVESLANAKRSRSSLRHSIAVMESSLWNGAAVPTDDILADGHAIPPNTPLSNSSQESQMGDLSTSLQQRALRKRMGRALAKDEADNGEATPKKNSSDQSRRRSARLNIVDKATNLLDRANSVLGKRSRDLGKAGRDIGRRASLRPRRVALPAKETASATTEPAPKKRRVSENYLTNRQPKDVSPEEEPTPPPPPPPPRYKPKIWLTHGLYTGQEPSNSPPKQRKSKNSAKTSTGPMQRRILPMPMFAGSRLVKNGRDYKLPFDIFSPLPPGQPKPDEWRKTNKNVFVGDAASEWKANKNLELSTCMCFEETGCDENCQNRYMFYECDNGNCRLGPECGNRNFNELKHRTKAGGKYNIGVEVIKTPDRGYGVRSNRTFEPNQIIVEYTGEIITQWECEKRMRTVYKNNDCYYLMYFDQNMIIDATRGSIARFVNHSCEPNCRMEKWTVAGKPRMALFAGDRGVMTGEELSYDYNFDPYSNKNVQQCRCGSENCRGVLGPRPKDKDQRLKAEAATNGLGKIKTTARKRKRDDATQGTLAPQGKKRKLLKSNSIKAGVQKAVAKASTARGKTATKKTATASTVGSKAHVKPDTKKKVKLPTVKAPSRVKASVRGPRQGAKSTKSTSSSPLKKATQPKRGSVETKKQTSMAAGKSSGSQDSQSPSKPKEPRTKIPAKARKPASNTKIPVKTAGNSKARSLSSSVNSAARGVAHRIKGMKK